MPDEFLAHVHNGPPVKFHALDKHLHETAATAASFGEAFKSSEWSFLAGLWHDIGKYLPDFQRRLRGGDVRVEHSGIGAVLAHSKGDAGLPLAFVIAGHHGALPNLIESEEDCPSPLRERIRKNQSRLQEIEPSLPSEIVDATLAPLPPYVHSDRKTVEFWTRFLFSTLVDADWLDTEAFFEPERRACRGSRDALPRLCGQLDSYLEHLADALEESERQRPINAVREHVLNACKAAACRPPGLFSLTAPTGSGKTLSSMAFALKHGVKHGLRRVIVVLPFTSIIEQNAEVYRKALGAGAVLEHHSNFDTSRIAREYGEESARRHELATENWDAPIIVTTTVQFFESLFSNRRGVCRKLHNIARSAIILDEVQALAPEMLLPVLDGLRELSSHYGCTVLLSTATPPALTRRESLPSGLEDVYEIIPHPLQLAQELKRVQYLWPQQGEVTDWENLCERMAEHDQCLAVLHRRADAREVAEMLAARLGEGRVYHLSALMCPKHRATTIAAVREALRCGKPCHLVSTQLIEAGVDIDFPAVFRAMAGLDSIVQAAGRCNREGKNRTGQVVVFRAPTPPPAGVPRKGTEVAERMLAESGSLDATDPATFETYFRMLYFASNLDKRGIQRDRELFNFATVARNFRLIEDGFTKCVVVPYAESLSIVERIRTAGPSREFLRELQPYIVYIYEQAFHRMAAQGAFEELCEGVYVLTQIFEPLYTEKYGLAAGDIEPPDPTKLVV